MTNIQSAIAEIKDHTEHNLKVKLSACTSTIVVQACEKQVPIKVKRVSDYYNSFKYCPACDCNVRREMTFCQECGQLLDWSGENNET